MLNLNIPEKATAVGNWWLVASSWQDAHSCSTSHAVFLVTQPHCSPYLVPYDFWLFPKLKSPMKGKRFQTISEIQENTMGQLMVIGKTVWGPKVPTLKGTEVPLSCIHCFLYLLSSPIDVSVFHSTWLDTFWTDLIFLSNEWMIDSKACKSLSLPCMDL